MLCQYVVPIICCAKGTNYCADSCLSVAPQLHHAQWELCVQKERMWLRQNPAIQMLSSRIPQSNGPSVSGFQLHIAYVLMFRDLFLGYYGTKKLRQQKWGVYIRKQRAVEYMCKKVTGGRPKADVTVAFGSARGPHMKGCLPAPVKLLHKALQQRAIVIDIDEFRTSVICSKCFDRDLTGVMCSKGFAVDKYLAGKRANSNRFRLYDVRACQNPSCRTLRNRNVNAARNMLEVYFCLFATGLRPEGFRRQ